MIRIKVVLVATVFLVAFLCAQALSFILVTVADHWHSIWSDGEATLLMDKEFLLSIADGKPIVFIPKDHTDSKIRKTPDGYRKYKEDVERLTEPGRLISIAGLELSVVKSNDPNPDTIPETLCHMGWIGETENAPAWDHRYDWYDIATVIKMACPSFENNACIAHHLKDCKVWADYQYLSHFSGMELFNDLGLEKNYIYHRDVYLAAQAKGWRGYGDAGSDTHNFIAQAAFGLILNYVCAESFDRYSVEQAIFAGRIIATNNLKVKALNLCPATVTQLINSSSFDILGIVEIDQENTVIKDLTVYKDGLYYKKIGLRLKRRVTFSNAEYDFDFSDSTSTQDHCYILEIYQHMITSPFCFQKSQPLLPEIPDAVNNEATKEPPKEGQRTIGENVLKISNAYENSGGGIEIVTENENIAYRFRFYNICGLNNLLVSENGMIIGCRSPLFTIYRQDKDKEIVLYASGSCQNTWLFKSSCIQDLKNGYFVGIGTSNFLAIRQSALAMDDYLLVTENKGVSEGETFIACNPNGRFRFNNSGTLISCDKLYEVRTRRVGGKELMRLDGLLTAFEGYLILLK